MMAGAVSAARTLLSDEQRRKVLTGTAEERTEVLKALDPDKRKQVLAALPPNVVSYTPEFKEEAEKAQKDARRRCRRRLAAATRS